MSSEARLANAPSMKLVRFGPFIFIGLLVLATAVGPGIAAGDAAAGKMLYDAKCGGCHSVDRNRVGPLHRGVVGRRAGELTRRPDSTRPPSLLGRRPVSS